MKRTAELAEVGFLWSCRGQGVIYVRLSCDFTSELVWEATSRTDAGVELPATVIADTDLGPILVLPVLMCAQHVEVRAFGAEGVCVAYGTTVVGAKTAKAASIVSGALRADDVELVREFDARMMEVHAVSFHAERLLHLFYEDRDPERLLHIAIDIRQGAFGVPDAPVRLTAFDVLGDPLSPDNVVCLSDTCREMTTCSAIERELMVSLRITPAQGSICLWVRFDGSRPDAFFVVTPNHMRDLSIEGDSHEIPVEAAGNYEYWMRSERADASALAAQRAHQESFAIRPRFSVIIPLYHTPVDFLREAVDSMLEQSYPNIELILVNSTTEDADLAACVASYAASDERVRVVELERNLGITENTNAGIAVATGDFLSFMDHDDIAERDLFYHYVVGINQYPDTDMLYCDEDLFIDGHYRNGFFKPDWSRAFEETNNYVCHLLTVRRAIVEDLPTPTRELDGAQDHSMTLAVSERARNVYHARKVLYHWRSHPLSTAQNPESKPEAFEAGRLAIARHLGRLGVEATVTPRTDWLHVYDVEFVRDEQRALTVVWWGEGEADPALRASLDASCERVTHVETACAAGADWSLAVAQACDACTSGTILIMSREARLSREGWAEPLLAYVQRADVALAGPRLLYADGTIASLGVAVSGEAGIFDVGRFMPKETGFGRGAARLSRDVTALSARCLAVDAEALRSVGGWDGDLTMEAAAIDAAVRVRETGHAVVAVCASEVVVPLAVESDAHRQSARERRRLLDHAELLRRYPKLAGPDRFYHESLSGDGRFGFEGSWVWLIPMGTRERLRFKLTY